MSKFRPWIKRIFYNKVWIGLLAGVFIAAPIVGMTTYEIVVDNKSYEINPNDIVIEENIAKVDIKISGESIIRFDSDEITVKWKDLYSDNKESNTII